jgi:hypothetical protein
VKLSDFDPTLVDVLVIHRAFGALGFPPADIYVNGDNAANRIGVFVRVVVNGELQCFGLQAKASTRPIDDLMREFIDVVTPAWNKRDRRMEEALERAYLASTVLRTGALWLADFERQGFTFPAARARHVTQPGVGFA